MIRSMVTVRIRWSKAMVKPLVLGVVALLVLYAVRGTVGRSILLTYLEKQTDLVVQAGDVEVARDALR